jgi:hypothetical protein
VVPADEFEFPGSHGFSEAGCFSIAHSRVALNRPQRRG